MPQDWLGQDFYRYSIMTTGRVHLLLLLNNGYRCANRTGIKDDNLRRDRSLVNAIVQRVHHFDDWIPRCEMQRLSVSGQDRELPAEQHAGIYHRVAVSLEPCSRRYAHPQNSDLGLILRIGRQ